MEYVPPKADFEVNTNHFVKSLGDYRAKISGTMAGAILGVNEYMSPFEASCRLLGICSEAGVSEKPAVRTGKLLESRIIDYVGQTYDIGTVSKAIDIFGDCEKGDHEDWIPHFQDPRFTGHVDGIVSKDGKDYILECKTARNLGKWRDEDGNVKIPAHYIKQIELYNHFVAKQDIAYLVLGAVTEADYDNPDAWMPSKATVEVYPVHIDQQKVAEEVETLSKWYDAYIVNGTTPQWCESNDRDMDIVRHLQSLKMSSEDASKTFAEFSALAKEVEDYDNAIADKRKKLDELKDLLGKAILSQHLGTLTDPTGCYTASTSSRTTKKWDEKTMVADGIDVGKYQTVSVSEFVTVKKKSSKKKE